LGGERFKSANVQFTGKKLEAFDEGRRASKKKIQKKKDTKKKKIKAKWEKFKLKWGRQDLPVTKIGTIQRKKGLLRTEGKRY